MRSEPLGEVSYINTIQILDTGMIPGRPILETYDTHSEGAGLRPDEVKTESSLATKL
jgi:hypothetical protein